MTTTGQPNGTEAMAERAAVAKSAVTERAGEVATEARDQAKEVAHDAVEQGKEVLERAKVSLHEQADTRTAELGASLRRLGAEASALADGRPGDAGPLADYARQVGSRVQQVADRVEGRGFDGVMNDVSDFGRRRPAAFLLAASAAGFAAGRVLRASRSTTGSAGGMNAGYGTTAPPATLPRGPSTVQPAETTR
jgi:hypothetical protein